MGINLEIKGQLAKLLATEDLIIENKEVRTASFNVDSRVLTLPIWDKADNNVYDLLVAHEVGHALFTPNEDAADDIPHQYVNVTEDARIEKLMKRKFMGLAKTFYRGYVQFHKEDFFEIKDEDINSMAFADRVNLYFKLGSFVSIFFTEEEQAIVDMVANAETFLDAQEAARAMHQLHKQQNDQEKVASVQTPKEGQGGGNEPSSMDMQDQSHQSEDMDEGGSAGGSEIETIQEFPNDDDDDVQQDDEVKTDSNLSSNLENLISNNSRSNEYVEIPNVNLKTIVNSNREISEYIDSFFKQYQRDRIGLDGDTECCYKVPDNSYIKFKKSAQKEVNYLVKEFECRKSASAYHRSTVSRTGVLDCTKLHTYKYNEDLFKKISVIPDGKNHGLLFVLDWSGSMTDVIEDTLKQLYNLVWFCKKVAIPFSVFAFTHEYNHAYDDDGYITEAPEHYMAKEGQLFVDRRFSMMEFFNDKTSSKELDNQMKNIWRISYAASHYCWSGSYMTPPRIGFSGTPLNESIVALHNIIPNFKKQNNLEKINCVILTDGEANHLARHKLVERRDCEIMGKIRLNGNCYLRDRKIGKTYKIPYAWYDFHNMMIENLCDRFPDINVIGIRVLMGRDVNSWMRRGINQNEFMKLQRVWKKERAVTVNVRGYTKYFGLSASSLSSETDFEVDEGATKAKIKSAFMKSLKTKKLNKKVLGEFVELIA